ncbi:hypothetical protein Bca52824_072829 [Brassica carinata]|uniref:Uncharacterized protein n=1 Tax=Brassica carinata TaxID=52824 RepID=A0A8X7QBX2_BRACI|nr:hypothetical protein Bca52824_072829 [Brassica carinata]
MDSSARLQYPPLLTQILLHFPTFHWCAKGYMSDYVLVSIGGIEQFLTSSACRQICPHLRWLQRSSSSRSVSTLPTHPLGSNRVLTSFVRFGEGWSLFTEDPEFIKNISCSSLSFRLHRIHQEQVASF